MNGGKGYPWGEAKLTNEVLSKQGEEKRSMNLAMAIVIHELMRASEQVGRRLDRDSFGGVATRNQN